jgi:hypothetical protein
LETTATNSTTQLQQELITMAASSTSLSHTHTQLQEQLTECQKQLTTSQVHVFFGKNRMIPINIVKVWWCCLQEEGAKSRSVLSSREEEVVKLRGEVERLTARTREVELSETSRATQFTVLEDQFKQSQNMLAAREEEVVTLKREVQILEKSNLEAVYCKSVRFYRKT